MYANKGNLFYYTLQEIHTGKRQVAHIHIYLIHVNFFFLNILHHQGAKCVIGALCSMGPIF